MSAFFTGFFLGVSLIVAIGAQNAFVIRQGILKHHVFYIALFCSISDSLLISVGIAGISFFLNNFINEYSKLIFDFSALWLFIYGILRLRSSYEVKSKNIEINIEPNSLFKTISIIAVFTFANPHVYLDTMILIGSVSQQFYNLNRIYFAIGACLASFLWFFTIAYAAKLLSPLMQKPQHWQILDFTIALIMFLIAYKLASQGNLLQYFGLLK